MYAKECASCGGRFQAKRADAKFCSSRCRVRATRANQRAAVEPPPPMRREGAPLVALPKAEPTDAGMVAVTMSALEAAGRVSTPMGQATLLIARILDSGVQDTGSSIAALIRQYDASLTKALEGAAVAQTPLERMKAQREQRAS